MQTSVLDQESEASLRAFVCWVPILPDDGRPDAGNLALVSDARATHLWDRPGGLPPAYRALLGLPEGWPAWDVYLAYGRDAVWDAAPPAPAFWHHQLGEEPDAPVLDPALFGRQLRALTDA